MNFDDAAVFEGLEDRATSGKLKYEDFPPEEYKYFSRLSRLGYLNHHKGMPVEECIEKQQLLKKEYEIEKDKKKQVLRWFKAENEARVKYSVGLTALEKARTEHERLDAALTVLEAITGDKDMKRRLLK